MDRLTAFKIYLAVRIAFLHNCAGIIKTGRFPKRWKDKCPTRNDYSLVDFLIKLSGGKKRTLLRLCVGNFLYGNNNFLYSEQHTEKMMKDHLDYFNNQDRYLQNELDVIQLRLYTFGSLENYLSNNKLLDDVFSKVVHVETLCLLYLTDNKFLPKGGYMFEDLISRIKTGSEFFELTEDRKNLILKYLVSCTF